MGCSANGQLFYGVNVFDEENTYMDFSSLLESGDEECGYFDKYDILDEEISKNWPLLGIVQTGHYDYGNFHVVIERTKICGYYGWAVVTIDGLPVPTKEESNQLNDFIKKFCVDDKPAWKLGGSYG